MKCSLALLLVLVAAAVVRADITSNLEAHWAMEDGSGTSAADSSGGGHTQTLTNTPTWGTGKVASGSLGFASASSEYGTAATWANIQGTGALTTGFWFRSSSAATQYLGGHGGAGTGEAWRFSLESGVVWLRAVSATGSWGSGLADGQWHHVAFTRPASATMSQVKCYVDGVEKTGSFTGGTTALNTSSTYAVHLAADPLTTLTFLNGDLDDIRIYSRELSAADVLELFVLGAATIDDPVAWWKLEETSGNATDTVGSLVLTDTSSVGTATGQIGNCRDFESATPSYFTMADHATVSFGDTNFSVAAWFKLESDVSDKTILSHFGAAGNRSYSLVVDAGLDRVKWLVSGDGTASTTVTANTFGAISVGTWYFVVARHDATNNLTTISVNAGSFDSAAHSTGAFNSTADFRVGYRADSALAFDGLIDEVRLYNRLLDARDVYALYLYTGAAGNQWYLDSSLPRQWRYLTRPKCETFFAAAP